MPEDVSSLSCPIPLTDYSRILLAHGGGGRLTNQLIENFFLKAFANPFLLQKHDATRLNLPTGKIAVTTDSYVIRPLFFPGGDIGSLAVNGTVNDLAMSGARPLYLSVGFILEEGLALEALWKITLSIQAAAERAGVVIVAGDTKVVDKGKADGVFINTTGIGVIEHNLVIAPSSVKENDAVLLSGDIGRHGMAIMAVREGLEFESQIESDCAPLSAAVFEMINAGIDVHCLRDLTRGGLASSLNEIAAAAQKEIFIDERKIAVREDVASACEMLGLDPLYVANEGRFAAFLPKEQAQQAVAILQKYEGGTGATVIGEVKAGRPVVSMKSKIGATRIVDMISGEQLPRIC